MTCDEPAATTVCGAYADLQACSQTGTCPATPSLAPKLVAERRINGESIRFRDPEASVVLLSSDRAVLAFRDQLAELVLTPSGMFETRREALSFASHRFSGERRPGTETLTLTEDDAARACAGRRRWHVVNVSLGTDFGTLLHGFDTGAEGSWSDDGTMLVTAQTESCADDTVANLTVWTVYSDPSSMAAAQTFSFVETVTVRGVAVNGEKAAAVLQRHAARQQQEVLWRRGWQNADAPYIDAGVYDVFDVAAVGQVGTAYHAS